MPETINDKRVFSLLEVSKSIQKTLTERYTSSFWIKGEVNKLNLYAQSGHCFPELVEKKDGRVIAELKSVLWRDDYTRINRQFLEVLHEPLKDGITILFSARIQFDPVFGLSLRITEIDPWYSLGELEKEKQLSIARLQAEGIFDQNKNLAFPLLPKRIAIISVESSKGYSDFMKIMNGNSWEYRFFSMLFPAFLQGDKAVPSIIYQLKRIRQVIAHFDVVAIIRGGGGDVGLTCYNDYELAKTIALYPLPVITGIGHSTNETVTEMVAFKNAITPTELADFLLQHYHEFSVPLQEAENMLVQKANRLIREEKTSLINLAKYLRSVTRSTISNDKQAIEFASKSLLQYSKNALLRSETTLKQFSRQLSGSANLWISRSLDALDGQRTALATSSRALIKQRARDLQNMEKVISILSPLQVLKRGYSFTTVNGKLVTTINEIKKGDKIITTVTDGSIASTVTSTKITTQP
ncbi:exodeoxyribonuclease VII large subunit [Flavitalea sp.]|nr:exodeoxyribonuclease VII large subunit [Flavitalea sp.]